MTNTATLTKTNTNRDGETVEVLTGYDEMAAGFRPSTGSKVRVRFSDGTIRSYHYSKVMG